MSDDRVTCPNCGHENEQGDRFCSNCGSRLTNGTSIPPQYESAERPESSAAPAAPPTAPGAQSGETIPEDPAHPEWRMSSLPEEEPPKRRTWLWVLGGIILLCVLLFCGFSIFVTYTDTGQNFVSDLSTRAADLATPVS